MSAVLALREVRRFHAGGFVLDVPALDVHRGEVLAVIGPNGSGKSTLLRVLGLLEPPDAGQVMLDGREVLVHEALSARRRLATVFQEPLLADTTVTANVALGLRFRGLGGETGERRVARWLDRLGIGALAPRAARTLSGGESQRVALARALVLEPEVLLLDEPFASLDQPARTALIADLGALLRDDRITTVLVTHHRGEALALADRVAVLLEGRVRQLDETIRVFRAPASAAVARFVGVETIVTGRALAAEAGVSRVEVAGRTLYTTSPVEPGAPAQLALHPEDVTLVADGQRPDTAGVRNVLSGSIAALRLTDAGVRVTIDCGFPLVALVSRPACEALELAPGRMVAAVVDAGAVHVIPGPACLDTPGAPAL
ncbi:MAG TPA: ABC transporter ATP-binding protein [Methylomirabilota bacterium]|nr:ABC transporter ATP-binding protein [Methylomirabilota bacterium]